jgi:hypothetical protein
VSLSGCGRLTPPGLVQNDPIKPPPAYLDPCDTDPAGLQAYRAACADRDLRRRTRFMLGITSITTPS